jgi:hypothetical protein
MHFVQCDKYTVIPIIFGGLNFNSFHGAQVNVGQTVFKLMKTSRISALLGDLKSHLFYCFNLNYLIDISNSMGFYELRTDFSLFDYHFHVFNTFTAIDEIFRQL